MAKQKVAIIGGVAGGASAAARLRRLDAESEITIYERGGYISYANCGLPYYIGDVIQERGALLLQTPEMMKAKFDINVKILHEVTQIDPDNKKLLIKNVQTGETVEDSFDKLIISTGSSPFIPPIPGIDAPNIFKLWSVEDTDTIKAFCNENKPKNAVVIGAGFIGIEMAENLHELGLNVNIVEMQSHIIPMIDDDMASLLHQNVNMNNVKLFLGEAVEKFENKGDKTTVTMKNIETGEIKTIDADLIILSIGVRPNSEIAKNCGIAVNAKGGIITNNKMETSHKDIYAVGDVIEVDNYITKERTMIPLAGPANKMGRIVADVIAGLDSKYDGSMGTSIAKVFDLSIGFVGFSDTALIRAGKVKDKDFHSIIINQKSHAGYYPGATTLTLKMSFTKEGKILGCQIIGQESVDKAIDIVATIMRTDGTIYDLTELELSYAPPFSSAKAPVNMLGFVAENILKGLVKLTPAEEVKKMVSKTDEIPDFLILDVTEDIERQVFKIDGSIQIPMTAMYQRWEELLPHKDKHIIVYCAVGVRSYNMARFLSNRGFENVSVMSGGTEFYKSLMHTLNANVDFTENNNPNNKGNASSSTPSSQNDTELDIKDLNCCGLQCPGPIMKVNETMLTMKNGESLKVISTDMGFATDIDAWCKATGNTLLEKRREGKENIVIIRKGLDFEDVEKHNALSNATTPAPVQNGQTIVVFSGDLDKVLASLIIANGAASMGKNVTMFFTFWGLNAIRKPGKQNVKKDFMSNMFGKMMPQGAEKLKISNMNMGGMGTSLMKKVMKEKNVSSLNELIKQAQQNGVRFIACTMSMDVLGITESELLDGVEYGGVAAYLGYTNDSNSNLFI